MTAQHLPLNVAALLRANDRLRASRARTAQRLLGQREVRGLLEDTVETWKEMFHEVQAERDQLRAQWLVEKSRADRADGELSVLREAVATMHGREAEG